MATLGALSTSRRGYLSQTELAGYADITITDTAEADDRISIAEEIIDAYVGGQTPFIEDELWCKAAAGTANTITLEAIYQNITAAYDYWAGCWVEIIGGTNAGERNRVLSSTNAGVLTMADNWTTTPNSTSFIKIYQMGKFPRLKDGYLNGRENPFRYYKAIPEAVKRAVAAQVEYMIAQGDKFFSTDATTLDLEVMTDGYKYQRKGEVQSMDLLIAPKARQILRGITNRKGQFSDAGI